MTCPQLTARQPNPCHGYTTKAGDVLPEMIEAAGSAVAAVAGLGEEVTGSHTRLLWIAV